LWMRQWTFEFHKYELNFWTTWRRVGFSGRPLLREIS
jgi:hypothetical protein